MAESIAYGRYIRLGMLVLALLIFGLGGWAALASISGAVIARGTIAVEGKVKTVQHLSGGAVSEIKVVDGDVVEAGDLLVRLDDLTLRAQLNAIEHRLIEMSHRRARLEAERDSQPMSLPEPDLQWASSRPDYWSIFEARPSRHSREPTFG